jgi:TP53 regulating kinase and related kinases
MDKVATPELFRKGAEASLFVAQWHGRKVLHKVRIPKSYRPEALDTRIRSYRTVHEPQLMHEAKTAGVTTPLIFMVNVPKATITMEYVEGQQVKLVLNTLPKAERPKLCKRIGELVGRLHLHGLVHGDLTTSNIILTPEDQIVFVDFGLGEKTTELEAQGVDLHLLKRALQSTHFQTWEDCFEQVMTGYSQVVGEKVAAKVYEKIVEIQRRGRYVEERKVETEL